MELKEEEWAITLGVKQIYRSKYNRKTLITHIKEIFINYRYSSLIISVEKYETTGLHGHIYYKGQPIYWIDFNKLYRIGYVKNRRVYDKIGWLNYMNKTSGKLIIVKDTIEEDESMIERFTGKTLEEEVEEFNKTEDSCTLDEPDDFDLDTSF